MRLAIIIPAYNEEKTIARVIKGIPEKITGISEINTFVINDGSNDKTEEIAQKAGATVLSHLINQGVGAATVTGLEAAKKIDADIAITLDADGQHDPKEIAKMVELILKKKYDVVIGTRLINRKNMPLLKSFGNFFMNWITFALYGDWFRDSQSGFKGFSRKALEKLELSSQGYEICSEIIGEIQKNKLKYKEIAIKTIYTDYSKKRGQLALNGVNIILKLIIKKITG